MNEKYTSLEELMNTPYKFDKYDIHKYKDYNYSDYTTAKALTEYEEFIRKIKEQQRVPDETKWREALDNMPIGFIEKYLRKKKLANIKQEEE